MCIEGWVKFFSETFLQVREHKSLVWSAGLQLQRFFREPHLFPPQDNTYMFTNMHVPILSFSLFFSGGQQWQRYSSKASSFSSSPSPAYASNSPRLFPKGTCMCVCAARGARESATHTGCTCMYTFAALLALRHCLYFFLPLSLVCSRASRSRLIFCTQKSWICELRPSPPLFLFAYSMCILHKSGHVWFFLAFTRISPIQPLSRYVPWYTRCSYIDVVTFTQKHIYTIACLCVLLYTIACLCVLCEERDWISLNLKILSYTCKRSNKCTHLCAFMCVSLYIRNLRWYLSTTIFSYIHVNTYICVNICAFWSVHCYLKGMFQDVHEHN